MSNVLSSWTNLRRTPYQSFTALLVVITTFFVIYFFSTLIYVGNQIITYFETRPPILVFFHTKVSDEQAASAAGMIEQLSYVDKVVLTKKTDALAIYKEENQDEPLLVELLTSDLFPASLSITATSPEGLEKIREELNKIEGIDKVDFRQDAVAQFLSWTKIVRNVGLGVCALFTTQFMLVIIVITSMKIANRRRSINIMSLLGTPRGTIRATFVRESMWLGLFGSLISFAAVHLLIYFFQPQIIAFLGDIKVLPLQPPFLLIQAGIGSAAAIMLASLAAWVGVTKLIKK